MGETPWELRRPAPQLGEHNHEVYAEALGYRQEELARLVGASRETVSRVLNGYRRQGILLTSHRRITIKDRPALERMAYV